MQRWVPPCSTESSSATKTTCWPLRPSERTTLAMEKPAAGVYGLVLFYLSRIGLLANCVEMAVLAWKLDSKDIHMPLESRDVE